MTKKLTMMLLGSGAIIASGALMLAGTPQSAAAANTCNLGVVRGTYGFQFTAFAPGMADPTTASVPFAETGTFVVDAQGNITGGSDASYGGQIFHQTFSGTLTLNPDCTGQVSGTNHTLGRPFNLRWVVVTPGEEVMLFSLEPGTVGNGRAVRMRLPRGE